MDVFLDSITHIAANLERLNSLLQAQVWRIRRQNEGLDGLQLYYISDVEADRLLGGTGVSLLSASAELARQARTSIASELAVLEEALAVAEERTLQEKGPVLRLPRLAQLFGLTTFDRDVLLICLAPELDERYARLYAYLQDDLRRRTPGVGLILDLLCPHPAQRLSAGLRLASAAPLRRYNLLEPRS